jgi:hypothetical protein
VRAFHGNDDHPNMAAMSIVAGPLQVRKSPDSFPCLQMRQERLSDARECS